MMMTIVEVMEIFVHLDDSFRDYSKFLFMYKTVAEVVWVFVHVDDSFRDYGDFCSYSGQFQSLFNILIERRTVAEMVEQFNCFVFSFICSNVNAFFKFVTNFCRSETICSPINF